MINRTIETPLFPKNSNTALETSLRALKIIAGMIQNSVFFRYLCNLICQMMNIADISEDSLRMRCPEVLKILLQDRTTGTNIFWATNDY